VRRDRLPTYCGVRTDRYLYTVYVTGDRELYDLRSDPSELTNLITDPSMEPVVADLHARLLQLCDPPPPGLVLPLA
jgi:N-acetylglucosamine-6-sulfatase